MQKKQKKTFDTPFTHIDLKKPSSPLRINKSEKKKEEKPKYKYSAYKITFKNHPDLVYISFKLKNLKKYMARNKAVWEATKYFKESLHPNFQKRNDYGHEMKNSCRHRIPEFDKYGAKGKVPIPELMKYLEAKFPCSICGKGNFDLEDYEAKRCFVVTGEGDLNPFTDGYLLCPTCYQKYLDASL